MSVLLLVVFLIVTLVCASIVATTLRVGISPMPSSRKCTEGIIEEVRLTLRQHPQLKRIYECGSGFGGLALRLASEFPSVEVVAFETSAVPFAISLWRQRVALRPNLTIHNTSFLEFKFEPNALIVAYLWTHGMARLKEKLLLQRTPFLVISNTFAFRGIEPHRVHRIDDVYNTKLYVYSDMSSGKGGPVSKGAGGPSTEVAPSKDSLS